jgi:hypothetical protein
VAKDVDGRDKPGHDDQFIFWMLVSRMRLTRSAPALEPAANQIAARLIQ